MKTDIFYLIVYILIEIINYTLVYVVVFHIALSKLKRKYVITILMLLLIHFLVLYFFGFDNATGISYFTMLLIPLLLFEKIEKKNIYLYPFVIIASCVIGISVSFLLAIAMKTSEYSIVSGNWYTIFCQCFQSFALIILAIKRKIRKEDSYELNLDWKQYLIFYIVAISLILVLAPIQVLTDELSSNKYVNILGFAVSISSIMLIVITIWYGISVNREIKLKEQKKISEEFIKLQKEYYCTLFEQDNKMRAFRHDMRYHITALKSIGEKENCKELDEYLNNIVEESAIYSIEKYTGNNVIDAVVRQLVSEAKNHHIEIEVKGELIDEIIPSEYDLCIILSNLIKNAVEACERIEDFSKRKIEVIIKNYNKQIYIAVKNTFNGEILIKNNRLISNKNDKKNHGIGSENVKNTVEKYGGILEYQIEKIWFKAEVNL